MKDGNRAAKRRRVGRGDKGPDLAELEARSSMISKEAWMMSTQLIVSMGFDIELGDIRARPS